jgi:hypothetical protein
LTLVLFAHTKALRNAREKKSYKQRGSCSPSKHARVYFWANTARSSGLLGLRHPYFLSKHRAASASAKKHDLHLIRILDPREITLPDTPDILCKNLGNNEPMLIRSSDKDFRSQYLQLFAAHENKVVGLCKSNGAGFLRISTSEPYLSSLISYFNQTFKGY